MSSYIPRWISEAEVRSVLSWDVLVPAMKDVLLAVTVPDATVQPLRSRLYDHQNDNTLLLMPGLSRATNALATKVITRFPGNSQHSLPTHSAIVLLMDSRTGITLAMLDGNSITELRTAAASAAATMAIREANEQPSNCDIVAILGAGVQALAHARVLNHVLKPKEVRIWTRRSAKSTKRLNDLVSLLLSEGIPALASDSVETCVSGADVINTCTLATTPVLGRHWVKEGAHINSVGAASKDAHEMEPALVLDSQVFADSKEAALNEAGDVIIAGAKVTAEIGEVISGKVKPNKDKTSIFKSLGLAVEDAVSARLVYDNIYAKQDNSEDI